MLLFLNNYYYKTKKRFFDNSKTSHLPSLHNVCVHGKVSEAPLGAALTDARIPAEVKGQRPNAGQRSEADAPAQSEEQALNVREHVLISGGNSDRKKEN